jgi:predicted negative regulator of RcsB-dependent stress response
LTASVDKETKIFLAIIATLAAAPLLGWGGWAAYQSAEDERGVEAVQTINSFHGQSAPEAADIANEMAMLRDTYGLSHSEARELLITVARSGTTWDMQKKLAILAIGLKEMNDKCGGKC